MQSIIKKVCRGDDKKMVAIAAASKQLNLINIFFDIYLQCGAAFVWNKDINTNQNISNYSLTFLGKCKNTCCCMGPLLFGTKDPMKEKIRLKANSCFLLVPFQMISDYIERIGWKNSDIS